MDVGRLDDRVFVNVSAGGFVAEASEAVTPELKTVTGRLAYLIGGAQALLSYDPVRARIEPVRRIARALSERVAGTGAAASPGSVAAHDSTCRCSPSATRR